MARAAAARIGRGAAVLLAAAALFFYFAQTARLPPNTVDGALILDYLEMICDGQLPYWDFVDVYGPLNWVFPALFYALAGREVWGVRVWMILLKIISVGATYLLVRRLADRFYALLVACCATFLLGQPFQFLQTPYAFHTAYPIIVLSWYLALFEPLRRPGLNPLAAGLCTAIVLWIKLNAGLFLWLGVLYYYFYWKPAPAPGDEQQPVEIASGLRKLYLAARPLGLAAYALVLTVFISRHFDAAYFVYLTAPLLLLLAYTLDGTRRPGAEARTVRGRLTAFSLYLGAALAGWAAFFFAYYGWPGGRHYLWELAVLVSKSAYIHPVPPIGVEGLYRQLSKWYWLQLPWLLTFFFCGWLLLQSEERGRATLGAEWPGLRARTVGLFAMVTLYTYVIYPRSDEPHLFQTMLPSVSVLMVLLFQLDRLLLRRFAKAVRAGLVFVVLLACSTIAVPPSLKALSPEQGDWYGHRMRFLDFRPERDRAVRNTSSAITDRDWDIAINRAGLCVDELSRNGSEVIVLQSNQLINYLSHTRPIGGRYRYLFYLLRTDLIDRKTLQQLVPPEVLQRLLTEPSEVIVGAMGEPPLLVKLPELRPVLARNYYVAAQYAHIFIYLPNQLRLPSGLCPANLKLKVSNRGR